MRRMLDYRDRTRLRRALYAKPTILLLGILAILLARGTWGMYQKSLAAGQKRDKATAELRELRNYAATLDADIGNLSTPRGQEAAIRDRFMVAKEGERVIVVTDPDKAEDHSVTITEEKSSRMDQMKAMIDEMRPE